MTSVGVSWRTGAPVLVRGPVQRCRLGTGVSGAPWSAMEQIPRHQWCLSQARGDFPIGCFGLRESERENTFHEIVDQRAPAQRGHASNLCRMPALLRRRLLLSASMCHLAPRPEVTVNVVPGEADLSGTWRTHKSLAAARTCE